MNELLQLAVECKKLIENKDSDEQTKQYYKQMLLDTQLYINGLAVLRAQLRDDVETPDLETKQTNKTKQPEKVEDGIETSKKPTRRGRKQRQTTSV